MEHLADVTAGELRAALDEVTDPTATQRLVAAIAYKHGTTQTELAEWFGVERRTIYAWLTRLDGDSLVDAAGDERRPGRPSKLSDAEQAELTETLRRPPTASGYGDRWWTPAVVRRHVRETFDVEYSLPSCRRLMEDAGLRYRELPHVPGDTDVDEDDVAGGEASERAITEADLGRPGGIWVPQ